MIIQRSHFSVALVASLCVSGAVFAQETTSDTVAKPQVVPIFTSEQPMTATLTTNIGQIRRDKGETPPWRWASFSYMAADGKKVEIPLKIRTRGIWRLKRCAFPPLRLDFAKNDVKGTELRHLDKPKLVNYCRDTDTYEQYVLSEAQLYRVYQLLTPASHKIRLLRLTYADSASGKIEAKRFGFLEEEPDAMAARNGGKNFKAKGARPDDLDPAASAIFGLFEYMIGNPDISISGLHNVELVSLTASGIVVPVAYDFDFTGAVNAEYATPDPKLNLSNVRDRRYMGFCVDPPEMAAAIALFNEKKPAIYALYDDNIGKLLSPHNVSETKRYFDEFYGIINNPSSLKELIFDYCVGKK